MKTIEVLSDLEKVLVTEKPIFYGAGKVTRHMLRFAAKINVRPECILVSYRMYNPNDLMWIPVKAVYELSDVDIEKSAVLVCVTEKWKCEIEKVLEAYAFRNIYFLTDSLIKDIAFDNADFEVNVLENTEGIRNDLFMNTRQLMRFIPKPCLEYMIVHILDHCNLKCRGCDHFACIADEHFVPYETIHRDIKRMSEIFGGDYIVKIAVMGGEPLLHPDLKKILCDIRRFFPYTTIRLSTNGILLLNQDEDFWKICREKKVNIITTKYPINLDFEAMIRKADSENVKFDFYENTGGDYEKHSFRKRINLNEDSNPVYSFADCHISNYGNLLLDGKFYACAFSCQSYRIFNKKFGQNLRITEDDYLDIFKTEDKKEFFEFAARPKFYCRYCAGIETGFTWSRSKGDINEWVPESLDVPDYYKTLL